MITIALVDDHPLMLKILHQELSADLEFQIVWQISDIQKLISSVKANCPDVLILDLSFVGQGFEPVSAIKDLRAQHPHLKILILTAYDDPIWIEELLKAGAKGYVVKSDDFSLRIADAVRTVHQGKTFLSPSAAMGLTAAHQKYTLTERERMILRLATEGRSNPDIAAILGVANGTVRNHISNIYAKLNVDNREAAIRAAQNLRELPKPEAHQRHELRTPLHTILGLARLMQTKLQRDGQLTGADQEYLEQLILEAQRLDTMIDDWADN